MSRKALPSTEASTQARDEKRLRELDRRNIAANAVVSSTVQQLASKARHSWKALSFIPAGGTPTLITNWSAAEVDNDAAETSDGVFKLLTSGVWALEAYCSSDGKVAGNLGLILRTNGVDRANVGYVGQGFPGAGYDYRQATFTAPFTGADLNGSISVLAWWYSSVIAPDVPGPRAMSVQLSLYLLAGDVTDPSDSSNSSQPTS